MTNSKTHIAVARFLLNCFIAGQCMVFAHQHNTLSGKDCKTTFAVPSGNKTVSEKCSLCDALHHAFFEPATICHTAFIAVSFVKYKQLSYTFLNYSLTAAGGRAPPLAVCC